MAIGADDVGLPLKEVLGAHVRALGYSLVDYGCYPAGPSARSDVDDYPDVAERVALAIAEGRHALGILVCGTGIGMAIAANKVPGVRAAQAHDTYSAERARRSNDAQIVTLGARVIGPELAKSVVTTWLAAEFAGESSPSFGKVRKLIKIDAKYREHREDTP